ncbi:MAG TPA: outer membrane beta-barrel protein [Cyclobacteriaceae bacterium]|jgi:hypothetical protein
MKYVKHHFNNALKHFILSAIFLAFSGNDVISQYKSPAGSLNFGISTYQGISFLEGAQFTDIKPGYAQASGLNIKYYQTITIGLQVDILYSKAAGTFSKIEALSNQNNLKIKTKQKLNFISVPISINLYLSDRFESENIHIKLGVVPSFLIKAVKSSNNPEENGDKVENSNDFRSMDFGFLAGIGVEVRRFNLIGEYYLGVYNLNANKNGSRITNHGPRIGLNYFLKRWD